MKPRIIVVTRSKNGDRSPGRISDEQFGKEAGWCFVIELLVFAVLVAISAWPLLQTAEALRLL